MCDPCIHMVLYIDHSYLNIKKREVIEEKRLFLRVDPPNLWSALFCCALEYDYMGLTDFTREKNVFRLKSEKKHISSHN